MKTGIEEIAAVKVNPRTEPLKGGAIMVRILTASLISSLSKFGVKRGRYAKR